MTIRADIEEMPEKNGRFRITCGNLSLISDDPEYELCHQLANGLEQDTGIEFFRNGMPTHSMPSVLKASRRRTSGTHYPYTIKRQHVSPARRELLDARKGENETRTDLLPALQGQP